MKVSYIFKIFVFQGLIHNNKRKKNQEIFMMHNKKIIPEIPDKEIQFIVDKK